MSDIAREAGVSTGAVSFALNGRPGVSPATRQRIKEAAAKLGWTPSVAARALSANRAQAVGLAIARPINSITNELFYLKLIAGLEQVLVTHGSSLMLRLVDDLAQEIDVHRQWWSERRVDGVVVSDPRTEDPRIAALADLGLPAVLIGSSAGSAHPPGVPERAAMSTVSIDDGAAMAVVIEHLAHRGHRRVAHVSGTAGLVHIEARTRALHDVGRKLGLTTETLITDFSEDAGVTSTRSALTRPDRATAIVYDNEFLALGGMVAISEAGLAIPDDVAIVSWEDSPMCRVVVPPITSLSRDAVLLGTQAAELLIELVDHGRSAHVVLDLPVLLARGSTGRQ